MTTIKTSPQTWIRTGLLLVWLTMFSDMALARGWLLVSAEIEVDQVSNLDLKKVYMGRKTQIGSIRVKPVNAPVNSPDRTLFLREVLKMSELDYTGYWHVRRYSGQGTPPPEVESLQALLEVVAASNNSIGYVMSEQRPEIRGALANRIKILPIELDD